MNYLDLETAAFEAWPADEQFEKNGLIYRFAQGYTKRANSVTVLKPVTEQVDRVLQFSENYFEQQALNTCIFRLCSFVDNVSIFDQYLQEQGYTLVEPSLVLVGHLSDMIKERETTHELDDETWLDVFNQMVEKRADYREQHLALIRRITHPKIFSVMPHEVGYAACGLGVVKGQHLGLFDIATNQYLMRQGYATRLISGLLSWGRALDATDSYVQVVESNHAAIKLYQKLGYQPGYRYWYRVKSKKTTSSYNK